MEPEIPPSSTKALSIDLIATEIASYLSRSDLLSLSLLNRIIFFTLLPTLWSPLRISSLNETNRLLDVLEPTLTDPQATYADYSRMIRELIITLEPGVAVREDQLLRLSPCLPNLQILKTRGRFIGGKFLLPFANHSPHLHTISLQPKTHDSRYLRPDHLSELFSLTPNLESFEGRLAPIDHEGMSSLFRHCPRLHTLSVATSLLSHASRDVLVHHGRNIRSLQIAFPSTTTDDDVRPLSALTSLRSLSVIISTKSRISSAGLNDLLIPLAGLTRLFLRDTPVSDDTLVILSSLQNLTDITLENHADLEYFGDHPRRLWTKPSPSSGGLAAFARQAGTKIRRLQLVHQPALDVSSFEVIAASCTMLRSLVITVADTSLVGSIVEFAARTRIRIEIGVRGDPNVVAVWRTLGWRGEVRKSSWLAPVVVFTLEGR